MVRWVSVLRAARMSASTRPVVSRRKPGRRATDHNSLSGLWFHCQTNGSAGSPVRRVNSSGATMPGINPLPAGRSRVAGTLPPTPITGQPSSHFTGTRKGTRPTAPQSWNKYAYHLPSGVSIRPPCATPWSCRPTRPS